MANHKLIQIIGARQHNLKNISVEIPKGAFTVITGPSGSGKSSLAFNTLFAEGQRRFMESLSTYVRQFLDKHEKPDVDDIHGISPTIAIEQKNHTKNSRSTVGTATEVYDYLRLFYAKAGVMYSPKTGAPVKKDLVREVVAHHRAAHPEQRVYVGFPVEMVAKAKIEDRKRLLGSLMERGFTMALMTPLPKTKSEIEVQDIQSEVAKRSSSLFGSASKKNLIYVIADRMAIDDESLGRFEDAMVNAYAEGFGRAVVVVADDENRLVQICHYTEFPSAAGEEETYPELSPLLFSFNSPMGACPHCNGFGATLEIDPNLVVPNPNLSIASGAIEPLTKPSAKDWLKDLLIFCRAEKISLNMPYKDLGEKAQNAIWNGKGNFEGISAMFRYLETKKHKMQVRVFLSRYRSPSNCTVCKGGRLRPEALHVRIQNKSIAELSSMTIEDLSKWFEATKFTLTEIETGKEILPQIKSRLSFLLRVGLDYLTLSRLAKTLSGGEAQRIALANQLGARLTQTCYVLDEPSIGLHPRDTERLIGVLKELAELKNTVVVVEHDPDLIKQSEYLIDIGPRAGEHGGQLMYQGAYQKFLKAKDVDSSTLRFLTGVDATPVPKRRRMDRFKDKKRSVHWLELKGLRENNLSNVNLKLPLQMLTCVTGVSGSGKSSAVRKTLYPALSRIFGNPEGEVGAFKSISGFESLRSTILIDQQPIGRSPRSNPITYMKGFDEIRTLFASTIEARKKSYHPGFFSFNVPGGRCETCEGEGYTRVEMLFMEDMFVLCDACEGKRFKPGVLEIKYNGKSIHEVLQLTVGEAKVFFGANLKLNKIFRILEKVGLGYLRLGQPATTLSGGESQRLKIAKELSQGDVANVLYVLDEPTTGLHFGDVKMLVKVLHELVERGGTVVVIEHNTDVMKVADWVVDFGPGGGVHGGDIVAEGTPEEVIKVRASQTAPFLKEALANAPVLAMTEILDEADFEAAELSP
ncbi:MAG TPA: excinuclease ABC subunit UvrA [Bdellovibrionota bacterium]|nr:excinuclease ABC subunit UvrA [Bdellovibrionota bacterium]